MEEFVRFFCTSCGLGKRALKSNVGKRATCSCGASLQIPNESTVPSSGSVEPPIARPPLPPNPGPSQPPSPPPNPPSPNIYHWGAPSVPLPTAPPANPFEWSDESDEEEEHQVVKTSGRKRKRESEDEPESSIRSRNGRNQPAGIAVKIISGIGAGLLLIGLFTPMVSIGAPSSNLGGWVSFIDTPWKLMTVGAAFVQDITEIEPTPTRQYGRPSSYPKANRTPTSSAPSRKPLLIVLVGFCSVLYPLIIVASCIVTAIQLLARNRMFFSGLMGAISLLGTVVYGVLILSLNTIEELRIVMILTSPGFGWAILIIGSCMLCAGFFRAKR